MKRITTVIAIAIATLITTPAMANDRKFRLFGNASFGWGVSDDNQIHGIPKSGTNLQTVSFQLQWLFTHKDSFVIQLGHERTGSTATSAALDDISVDWLFYRRRFKSVDVTIGRFPLPWGIHNEIRDVGIALPFYRAPISIYGEGGQTTVISQNLDGLGVSWDVRLGPGWSIGTKAYAGEWEGFLKPGEVVSRADFTNVKGGQLWLNTPSDIRLGFAANSFDGPGLFSGLPTEYETQLVSLDVPLGWFTFQAEYVKVEGDFSYDGWYVHAGVDLTRKLHLTAQYEKAEFELVLPFIGVLPLDYNEDVSLGLSYSFLPSWVLKGEYHFTEGYAVENVPINPFGPPLKTNYGILSFAVSF